MVKRVRGGRGRNILAREHSFRRICQEAAAHQINQAKANRAENRYLGVVLWWNDLKEKCWRLGIRRTVTPDKRKLLLVMDITQADGGPLIYLAHRDVRNFSQPGVKAPKAPIDIKAAVKVARRREYVLRKMGRPYKRLATGMPPPGAPIIRHKN